MCSTASRTGVGWRMWLSPRLAVVYRGRRCSSGDRRERGGWSCSTRRASTQAVEDRRRSATLAVRSSDESGNRMSTDFAPDAANLLDVLRQRADSYGDKLAFSFSYNGDGENRSQVTY